MFYCLGGVVGSGARPPNNNTFPPQKIMLSPKVGLRVIEITGTLDNIIGFRVGKEEGASLPSFHTLTPIITCYTLPGRDVGPQT